MIDPTRTWSSRVEEQSLMPFLDICDKGKIVLVSKGTYEILYQGANILSFLTKSGFLRSGEGIYFNNEDLWGKENNSDRTLFPSKLD